MNDTLITSTADLNKAFAPVPKGFVEMQAHYEKIAEAINNIETPQWVLDQLPGFDIVANVKASERHASSGGWTRPELCLNGSGFWNISFQAETTGSTWRRTPTGRDRITVGDYGSRVSYPQKKDGSFSYDKIAGAIAAEIYQRAIRRGLEQALANAEKINATAVKALNEEFGLKEYDDVCVVSSSKPGILGLRLGGYKGTVKHGKAEQIRVVLEAMRTVGWNK